MLVCGASAKASSQVREGQVVVLHVPGLAPSHLLPEPIPLCVIYEDSDVIVLDKPAGLVVHPAAGHRQGTLVNALLFAYPDLAVGGSIRPGIVHRLDKDTSGLMIVARNDRAHAALARQMKEHSVVKVYLALAQGHLATSQGTIDAPIARDRRDRQRMAIVEGGREARSHFHVVEQLPGFDLVEVTLETGRTHQIRVHLRGIGHPVAGDVVYGHPAPALGLRRQFLHACRLGFVLPGTSAYREFVSPLPADLQGVLDTLRDRSQDK